MYVYTILSGFMRAGLLNPYGIPAPTILALHAK